MAEDETGGISFSLYKDSRLEITAWDGDMAKAGYFVGIDRNTTAITIKHPRRRQASQRSKGPSVRKFTIDRLGQRHRVRREKWPGNSIHPTGRQKCASGK